MSQTALIVEDEIFVALDLERILTDAGYNVAGIAADSRSAIECAPAALSLLSTLTCATARRGPRSRVASPRIMA